MSWIALSTLPPFGPLAPGLLSAGLARAFKAFSTFSANAGFSAAAFLSFAFAETRTLFT